MPPAARELGQVVQGRIRKQPGPHSTENAKAEPGLGTGDSGDSPTQIATQRSRGNFHFNSFQGSFVLENHQKPEGNGCLLKRTMAEKSGESTPRREMVGNSPTQGNSNALRKQIDSFWCNLRDLEIAVFTGGIGNKTQYDEPKNKMFGWENSAGHPQNDLWDFMRVPGNLWGEASLSNMIVDT